MNFLAALLLAPLLLGVVRRTKAVYAGRAGAPLLQGYFDLFKLMQRGAVYSATTTWLFRLGPTAGLAATIVALALTPLGGAQPLVFFPGDFVLLTYLLAGVRFFTVLAALDTGSAFEGMGASREVQFSALAEPVFLLAIATLSRATGEASLGAIFAHITPGSWAANGGGLALVVACLALVFLCENARIPFDDPNTHLELTMIHEVMVLDHGGPDLGLIEYAGALRFWILGSLMVGLMVPVRSGVTAIDLAAGLAGLVALAVAVGLVESSMARLRLLRVPQMLLGGSLLAVAAMFLVSATSRVS